MGKARQLHKSTLGTPNHFLVLHTLGNYFQEDLLHHLPRDSAEAAWPAVPQILKARTMVTFLQSSGIFSDHHDLSKIIIRNFKSATINRAVEFFMQVMRRCQNKVHQYKPVYSSVSKHTVAHKLILKPMPVVY